MTIVPVAPNIMLILSRHISNLLVPYVDLLSAGNAGSEYRTTSLNLSLSKSVF